MQNGDTSVHCGANRTSLITRRYTKVLRRAMSRLPDAEVLLTPREVADLFGVDPKTVTRWAKAGKLTSIRTLGGHRRYRKSEVDDLRANYFKAQ
jgi:excisionase family DNA binding protein